MSSDFLSYWLAALHLQMRPKLLLEYLKTSTITTLFATDKKTLVEQGFSEKYAEKLQKPNWKRIQQDLEWMQEDNHHIITFDDAAYPSLLKEIADPPLVLFVQGHCNVLSQKQLAIVGSRQPTYGGLQNAEQFAFDLVNAGFAITSGLARGIDGASHKGALFAKGVTIAVAGTGLNHVYPTSHRQLAADILASGGVLVSEFPLDTPPYPQNFPRRNRIIAGLSLGVLVIEAAIKSGSLITARLAAEEGREVFAIPGSIHEQVSQGCHQLIKQGAKLVESAEDILEELGPLAYPAKEWPLAVSTSLTPDEAAFLQHLGYEIMSLDVIMLRSQLTRSEVSSILLKLELQGFVQTIAGGYVRVAAKVANTNAES